MSMTAKEIITEALSLSSTERARIAEELISSLEDDIAALMRLNQGV